MKLVRIWVEVDEKVVSVAAVAIPEIKQSLESPKSVEGLQVYHFSDGLFVVVVIGLEFRDEYHVRAGQIDVETVNRQHVPPLSKLVLVYRNIEWLKPRGNAIVIRSGGFGIPLRIRRADSY